MVQPFRWRALSAHLTHIATSVGEGELRRWEHFFCTKIPKLLRRSVSVQRFSNLPEVTVCLARETLLPLLLLLEREDGRVLTVPVAQAVAGVRSSFVTVGAG